MSLAVEPTAYEILHVRADAHPDVIRAAYRALARISHPDIRPEPDADRRMVALNGAYARIGAAAPRAAYDAELARRAQAPTAPSPAPSTAPVAASRDSSGSPALDFGRYMGWTIAQLARHDPDYLRWLSRHSSGIRYRGEIDRQLRAATPSTGSARVARFSPFWSRRAGAGAA
ncbi:MAG: DnaJ domain-containing protein [Candidatus Limnocylindria bacterium]